MFLDIETYSRAQTSVWVETSFYIYKPILVNYELGFRHRADEEAEVAVGEREAVAETPGRFAESRRRVVARLRAGWLVDVHAATGLADERGFGRLRGAPIRLAVHRGPNER